MKLKGLTKLALSGVALAAVAATLGTSTYAWYVSNSTATVEGLNGSSASASSGNLLVADLTPDTENGNKLKEAGDWSNALKSISLKQVVALDPVSKDKDGFTPASSATGWHDKALKPVALNKAYGYYAFGIWSTSKVKADVKFGVANTTLTADFHYQTCYNSTGMGNASGHPVVNESFTSDFVKALKFDVIVTPLKNATIETVLATTPKGSYNAETALNSGLGSTYTFPAAAANTPSGKVISGGDAHAYYKAITGEDVTTTTGANPTSTINGGESHAATDLSNGKITIDLPKVKNDQNVDENVKYVVAIRYWLEGADTDCFDSCNNQSFALNMSFEAKD